MVNILKKLQTLRMQKKEMAEKEISGKWSLKIKNIKLRKKIIDGKEVIVLLKNNNYNM